MTVALFEQDRAHMLERSGRIWEDLRDARIFITGGTGFVGTWLVEALCAANDAFGLGSRTVLLTRSPERFAARAPHLAQRSDIEFLSGDAVDFALPEGRFDFVIHAATERYYPADADRPLSIFEDDLRATRRVLDLARRGGAKRLLFTSSGAMYGKQPPALTHIPESYGGAPDTTDPASAYGQSKRASEFACVSFAKALGFDAVVARLFAFVGPYLPLDEGYAVGNFIGDVIEDRAIAVAGDGTPLRSYLYAADLAVWLWTLLLRGKSGCAYNVGSPEALSIRELAETVADALGSPAGVSIAKTPVPGVAPARYVPSTARAESELGLKSWIPLREGILRTFRFYRHSRMLSNQ